MQIKHIDLPSTPARVLVQGGKTGSRRIPLISSVPYLVQWLSLHPQRDSPEALVWISVGTLHHGEQLAYGTVHKLLKELAEKAGVKKRINPHSFRHARATHLAASRKFKNPQLCQFFGWGMNSRMPGVYFHLSGDELDDAYMELHGMKPMNHDMQPVLEPKPCPRCSMNNGFDARMCQKCGMPFQIDGSIMEMMGDNRVMKQDLKEMIITVMREAMGEY